MGAPGSDATFAYPTSGAEARAWLDDFLEHRFTSFGLYEDAISTHEQVLFHSVLTPVLNIGLLSPKEVADAALAYVDRVPLNSLERFIRQVIGCREFVRLVYRTRGRQQRTRNYWNYSRPIPAAFYSGTTGIEPVDHVIRHVLDTAYCHHIERLMILGNFMLLSDVAPDAVYEWFMELFIDANDLVMVPNLYGMSQFADGGGMTTKPYISGSSYVLKMSDFRKGSWCAEVVSTSSRRLKIIPKDLHPFVSFPRIHRRAVNESVDDSTASHCLNVGATFETHQGK